jgi:hypothetical protein
VTDSTAVFRAGLWGRYMRAYGRRVEPCGCAWACRLCSAGSVDRDPVAAIRAHLAEAHGTTTPTRVSTDVRDAPRSIYDRTR